MKSHFILKLPDQYARLEGQKRVEFDADKSSADLFEQHTAAAIGNATFGPGTHGTLWKLEQATLAEHMSWKGRQGGKATSPRKTRASRRNGRNARAKATA